MKIMIDVTTVQRDLVKFQKKYYPAEKPGTVVSGYWKGFRKINRHFVILKQGQKINLIGLHEVIMQTLLRCMTKLLSN